MSKRKNEFNESLYRNEITYRHYVNHLTELATSMFEWKNLPDTISPRYLEMTLFKMGKSVFFKDDEIGFLALPVSISDRMGFNDEPIRRRGYAQNGYHIDLDNTNSVIIYNNIIRQNSLLDVVKYSRMLYELDRSIEVNARAQKTPYVIVCDENERLSFLNLYKEIDGNAPVVHGDKDLDLHKMQVLNTNAPFVADKLYTLKTQTWNEALTHLGISNVNIQKRERLISDEVNRQSGGTIASRYSRLEMRRLACKEINKMFGLNIDVDYREDYRSVDFDTIIDNETGQGVEKLVEGGDDK